MLGETFEEQAELSEEAKSRLARVQQPFTVWRWNYNVCITI